MSNPFVSQTLESVSEDLHFLEAFMRAEPEDMPDSLPALARMLRRLGNEIWDVRVLLNPELDPAYAEQLEEQIVRGF